jgi:hypothetical protein
MMKENSQQQQTAETEIPVPVPPIPRFTPTLTLYGELAAALTASLDQFAASVPGFDDETVSRDFVRRKKRISPEFVKSAVSALFGDNELLGVKPLDGAETMDDKQYIDAMNPVVQKLLTVYKRLNFTVQVREARLVRKAQQIYGIAKELARDRETSTIKSHVDQMARTRQLRRRTAKPEETPPPSPAPDPPGKEEPTTTIRR